jgi:hypothetical protein
MKKPYVIGFVAGCGLCALLIAVNLAGSAQAQQLAPATSPGSSQPASLEDRVQLLERAISRPPLQPSLAERVQQLERKVGTVERSLSKPSEPTAIDPERVRTSVESLERTTRAIETRLASLERTQRGGTMDRASQDLLELNQAIDRLVVRVDDLDLRVRRLERATQW